MHLRMTWMVLALLIGSGGCDSDSAAQEEEEGEEEGEEVDTSPDASSEDTDGGISEGTESAGCGVQSSVSDGSFAVEVDGAEQSYLIDFPNDYDKNRAYPLIFAFHFAGGSAQAAKTTYNLGAQVGSDGIIVYPNGNDIPVFDAILASVESAYCIDKGRIFATGLSLGAGMSNTLGCERGDVLRAIAPVAGTGPTASSACKGRVAVMQIHGTNDQIAPISGSLEGRARWIMMSGCNPDASDKVYTDLTNTCKQYADCDQAFPVVWCQHGDPIGHVWPAFASKTIWAFFNSYQSSPQGEPAGEGAVPDAEAGSTIKFSIRAPDDFTETPKTVAIALYPGNTSQPILLPPTKILKENIDPKDLAASVTVDFEETVSGFQGLNLPRNFTFMVTVYVVGGGNMIPTPRKDHLGLQKVRIETVQQDLVLEEVIDLVPVAPMF